MQRQTDIELQQKAARLKLSFIRDHLAELLDAAEQTKMTPREQLDYLFTKEIEQRNANRYKQGLMAAHFPAVKTFDSFDFAKQPSINPGVIRELRRLEWISTGENVTLFGPPGVGKTHLAIAFGRPAVEHGYSVRFCSGSWRKRHGKTRWKPS